MSTKKFAIPGAALLAAGALAGPAFAGPETLASPDKMGRISAYSSEACARLALGAVNVDRPAYPSADKRVPFVGISAVAQGGFNIDSAQPVIDFNNCLRPYSMARQREVFVVGRGDNQDGSRQTGTSFLRLITTTLPARVHRKTMEVFAPAPPRVTDIRIAVKDSVFYTKTRGGRDYTYKTSCALVDKYIAEVRARRAISCRTLDAMVRRARPSSGQDVGSDNQISD